MGLFPTSRCGRRRPTCGLGNLSIRLLTFPSVSKRIVIKAVYQFRRPTLFGDEKRLCTKCALSDVALDRYSVDL